MIVPDVDVLIYAHREDAADHERYRVWLEAVMASEAPYGVSDVVLSGFLRVVTHPRIFDPPTPLDLALDFVEVFRTASNATPLAPGRRHWEIFTTLCRRTGAKGTIVPDAYLAALAIDTGSEWVTADRGFARFPGLSWRHPLDGPS